MERNRFSEALSILMPRGGWSTNGTIEGTVIHEDGVYFGYNVPTQAQVDAAMLEADNVFSNQGIKAQLEDIDAKSIRAIREGDTVRIADYEAQAAALRSQLIP